jgi:amidase
LHVVAEQQGPRPAQVTRAEFAGKASLRAGAALSHMKSEDGGRDVEENLLLSAIEVSRMVGRGDVSSVELTGRLLARIDAVNSALNAVVELRGEEALQEAGAADAAIARGENVGPLHGVPMTIKESFNVAGMHTTWGNPAFRDHVANADATIVQRLRRAGAILVGKTNVHFMLGDFAQTANDLYGVTNNPWDVARTPGGSTGGGAAALAAGMTFLEYGSDLVGSIRIPASFCGVYGLKPSVGIVPLTGFQPPGPLAPPSDMNYMSAIGPLGRSAGDLRAALTATAGPEEPQAKAYTWSLSPPRHPRLDAFRVGVVLDDDHAKVSSDVAGPLSDAVDALAGTGARIVEGWPEGLDPGQAHESFGAHVQAFFAFQESDSAELPGFVEHERRRMSVRATWTRYFEETDVFLCPTNFTPAFPHDTRPFEERTIATSEGERPYGGQTFWVSHASLPGLPAAVAPVGTTPGGLPVGMQIIGPLFEDDTAITFAELLADVVGGYEPPPIAKGQ